MNFYLVKLLLFSEVRKLFVFSLILLNYFYIAFKDEYITKSLPYEWSSFFYYFVNLRPIYFFFSSYSVIHIALYLKIWWSKNLIHSSISDSTGSIKTIVSFLFISYELFVEFLAAESPFDFCKIRRSEFLVLLKRNVLCIKNKKPRDCSSSFWGQLSLH